jgi:hypothetical protein
MRTRRSMKSVDSRWLAKSAVKTGPSYSAIAEQGSFPGGLGWLVY